MDKKRFDPGRRRLFKYGFWAAAALALLPLNKITGVSAVLAADKPEELKPTDPMAQSLGYVEEAAKVDKKKWPKFEKSQNCANCMFYTKFDAKRGKCQIFSQKLVYAKGWCNSWAKKAG